MTDVEKVRLKIGDTEVSDALFSDTELEAFLEDEGTVGGAAAAACESLAARFAPDYDVSTDDQSLKRSQKSAAFAKLAETLRGQEEKDAPIETQTTERVDGYNLEGLDNESVAGSGTPGGRVRAGYRDPDEHP